jgi:hypothetical protein
MNKFTHEFSTLLRLHLLPEPNCLPNNFYVAKTLTCQLGLDYMTIHAFFPGSQCIPIMVLSDSH